jgi:hypothetical protein
MFNLSQFCHEQRMRLLDFMSMDTTSESVAEIQERLLEFYSVFNVVTATIGSPVVYRVRKIDPGAAHTKLTDVWHPPAEYVKKIGRANDVGQAIFYCSLDPMTAIQEAKILDGERFSLATYKIKIGELYEGRGIVIKETNSVSGSFAELSRFGTELSRFMVKEFTKNVKEGNEDQYKRSCAIAKILLDLPNADSIIYPSVRNSESVNIAYTSTAAAQLLELFQVATCELANGQPVRVERLWVPAADGSLIEQSPTPALPAPFMFVESMPKFYELFS